jgi:hypothetical protein
LHLADGVIGHLLDLAGVADEADTVDRHRGLRDIGADNGLADTLRRIVEDLLLLSQAEGAVEGQDDPFGVELRILSAGVHNLRKNIYIPYHKAQGDVEREDDPFEVELGILPIRIHNLCKK